MTQLFANNAYGSLGATLSNSATSLTLATGQGARFPSPTGGDHFLLTLVGLDSNGNENAWEIVSVTGRSTDALTIVRAQEGTTALTWVSGTRVELRSTAGTFDSFTDTAQAAAAAPVQSVFGRTGAVVLGSGDVTTALGFTPENAANKGIAGGYAGLDGSGLVPASQLPSYVDDVLEYADFAALPSIGASGKIYVLATPYTSGGVTSSQFRWSGSAYAHIVASPGTTDAVTEGSLNLYFTNARAQSALSGMYLPIGGGTLTGGLIVNSHVSIGTASTNLLGAGGSRSLTLSAGVTAEAIASFEIQGARSAQNSAFGAVSFYHKTNRVASITATRGSADDEGDLRFYTQTTGGALTERLAISPTGFGTATQDWSFQGVRVGRGAGAVSSNTAVGASALAANTTGSFNVAIGPSALNANQTGNQAVAIGYQAGRLATAGNITAVGTNALQANTTGPYNDAFGVGALYANTTGGYNVAFGSQALQANTTASYNTAVGYQAGFSNQTGQLIVAVGRTALRDATGSDNTAVGGNAAQQTTTGSQITAIGKEALYGNTSGSGNTAVGVSALGSNTTASYSTAVGFNAGINSSAGYNTYVGSFAGRGAGEQNTFVGYACGYSTTSTGNNNTGLGGGGALSSLSSGYNNVILGFEAGLSVTSGYHNTAVGSRAIRALTTGIFNTCIGSEAGYSLSTGDHNLFLGYDAAYYATTGGGNIAFGSTNSSGSYAPVFSLTTENNRVLMGSTSVTNAYIQVAWTVTSDARDKMDFEPINHGLAFVRQLQPTAYYMRASRDQLVRHGRKRYGFKAQDILALEGDEPVIIDDEQPDHLKYQGEALVPVLTNAIKEMADMIDQLKAEVTALKGN